MMEVAVLISGRGSNLEALLNHQQGYVIKHVISNNANAKGLEIAKQHGTINTFINWDNKVKAEQTLDAVLNEAHVNLIVLAGFMKILSADFIHKYPQKIINIHPSLLPKYPGLYTHQKVLNHQDKKHGATIHLVDDQLDQGPILAQTTIDVLSHDDEKSLAQRLIIKEHKLLTHVMGLIAAGELQWTADRIEWGQQTLVTPLMID